MPRKCASRDVVLNPWQSQEKYRGRFLGHRTNLKAKAEGDKSMSEKRESLEGVEGAVLRDPRDKVKAKLPEAQSPAVEAAHSRLQRLLAVPSRVSRSSFAVHTLYLMGDA